MAKAESAKSVAAGAARRGSKGGRATNAPPSEAEVQRTLEALIADADELRAGGLSTLELVRRARVSALQRQVTQLEAGQDPHVRSASETLTATEAIAQQFGLDAKRARVDALSPTDQAWTIHGHVLDDRLEPISRATVSLVDRKGTRVRGASAPADADGYFRLEWAPPAATRARVKLEVHLRVTSGRSRVLYEDALPSKPVVGAVEYAEIVIQEAGG